MEFEGKVGHQTGDLLVSKLMSNPKRARTRTHTHTHTHTHTRTPYANVYLLHAYAIQL